MLVLGIHGLCLKRLMSFTMKQCVCEYKDQWSDSKQHRKQGNHNQNQMPRTSPRVLQYQRDFYLLPQIGDIRESTDPQGLGVGSHCKHGP